MIINKNGNMEMEKSDLLRIFNYAKKLFYLQAYQADTIIKIIESNSKKEFFWGDAYKEISKDMEDLTKISPSYSNINLYDKELGIIADSFYKIVEQYNWDSADFDTRDLKTTNNKECV